MKNFVLGTIACAVMVGMISRGGTFGTTEVAGEAATMQPAKQLDAWELAAQKQRQERSASLSSSRRAAAMRAAETGNARSSSGTVLQRQPDGHFYSDVKIQGRSVEFLVDTGASMVALSESDARRAGVSFNRSNYRVIGSGASGPVRGQYVTLSNLTFGGRTHQNVPAVVLEGGDTSLLGQSVLSRYAIDMTGEKMTIR
ncbi:retropepsin-like aspartic protease family protein [Sphingomicrobium flavum]|uniref:retropepsin-like aspartic protease family protein n=1 Tax=Sphingomicrobium flavum TaxID=1229164 RepID=UPI0021AE0707|nr:TIGR02281 family clan AA aspartic protease [Sphingomicrobium flavum]